MALPAPESFQCKKIKTNGLPCTTWVIIGTDYCTLHTVPDDEHRCTSSTRSGKRCTRWRDPGTDLCTSHARGGCPRFAPDDQRCIDTRPDGQRCRLFAENGGGYCFRHGYVRYGYDHERRCTATASGGKTRPARMGDRCRNVAMVGQSVCRVHGGKSPQALWGAEVRLAEERIRAQMKTFGEKLDTGPTETLLDEVQWTAGHVAWLRERISALDPDALTWSVTRMKDGGHDAGTTEEAGTHALVKVYQAERKHLVSVSSEAIRCGIEERYIRIAEQQGALVASVIKAILGDLNLTPQQQKLAENVVPFRLRELAA